VVVLPPPLSFRVRPRLDRQSGIRSLHTSAQCAAPLHVLTLYISLDTIPAMNMRFVLHAITFVWDSNEASTNLRKHGILFEQAAEAFFDPFLKLVDASRHEEARDAIIGMDTRWNLLFVVHIELEDDAIRIISARKATRRERTNYEA
jgi:uncharacterized protein